MGNSVCAHLLFPIWVQAEIQSFGGNFLGRHYLKFPFPAQQEQIKAFNEDCNFLATAPAAAAPSRIFFFVGQSSPLALEKKWTCLKSLSIFTHAATVVCCT